MLGNLWEEVWSFGLEQMFSFRSQLDICFILFVVPLLRCFQWPGLQLRLVLSGSVSEVFSSKE